MSNSGTLFDRVSRLAEKAGMQPLPKPETVADYKAVPVVLCAHLLYQCLLQLHFANKSLSELVEHFTGEQLVSLNDEPNGEA